VWFAVRIPRVWWRVQVIVAVSARLRRLALHWLAEQRAGVDDSGADVSEPTGFARYTEVRFDVVSVLRPLSGATSIEHLRGAF
jgi:hypothetical protein